MEEIEDTQLEIESKVELPSLSCPSCNGLLPSLLGEITCKLCNSKVKITHPATIKSWENEKLPCPDCGKVLIVGIGKRPCEIKCGSCDSIFVINPHIPKVEVQCPSCRRRMRVIRKPGTRKLNCPACETGFNITC